MPWIDPRSDYLRWPRHLAALCCLAQRSGDAQALACKGGYPRLAFLDDGLGFIAGNRRAVVVILSGSRAIEDWRYNCCTDLVPGYGGQVHQGFAALASSIEESIRCAVGRWRDGGQSIWVAGYSRGGALATLTAVGLHRAMPNGVQACTFGAPRTGELAFARAYRVPHYRFENVGDPVPYFPLDNYVSVGTRVLLTPAGRVYVPDGSATDRAVVEEEGTAFHRIEEYWGRLQSLNAG